MEKLSCLAKLLPRPACNREDTVNGLDFGWALVIAVSIDSESNSFTKVAPSHVILICELAKTIANCFFSI